MLKSRDGCSADDDVQAVRETGDSFSDSSQIPAPPPLGVSWVVPRRSHVLFDNALLLPPLLAAVATRHAEPPSPSEYLMRTPRTLREVCQTMQRDDEGRRCPVCDLNDLCAKQTNAAAAKPG